MKLHPAQQKSKPGIATAYHCTLGFLREEDGVTAIEYALLAAVIVIAAVGGIGALSSEVATMWSVVAMWVKAVVGGAL